MAQSILIAKKYVTLGESQHWTCNLCQHKSKGRPNRMIAHLARIPNRGIKTCPKISLEESEKIRELGSGSHSTDADGQQPQQAREKDDIVQERRNKKRKSVSGSGTSGSDPRDDETSSFIALNPPSALGERISVPDTSTGIFEDLENVGATGLQLDNPEWNSPFPVSDLFSFPPEASDAFRTVPPETSHDQERSYVPNTNNDPIPPPLPVDSTNDQHMHPLQVGVGNGTSPFRNASCVEIASAHQPPHPPGSSLLSRLGQPDNLEQNPPFSVSDLFSFPLETSDAFRTVLPDTRADGPNMTNDPIPPPLPVGLASDQHMHPLQDAVRNGTCTSPLGNAYGVKMTNVAIHELRGIGVKTFGKRICEELHRLYRRITVKEKEIMVEMEQGDQMLVTKRNNDRDRWLGYAKNFKCDVNDLKVEVMKAESLEEMIPLLSRVEDLTKTKDRLIEMGTALLNPVPKDILLWNPTYMSCKSQLVNQMPLRQVC